MLVRDRFNHGQNRAVSSQKGQNVQQYVLDSQDDVAEQYLYDISVLNFEDSQISDNGSGSGCEFDSDVQ